MDVSAKRVVVMGLGSFGGGIGVARFMSRHGADVLVTDVRNADDLADSLDQLDGLQIDYRLGGHNVSDFTTADLIVVNPAINPEGNRFLRAAAAAGVSTTTEIRLLTKLLPNPNRTIGVTGSAGKSTVTAMTGHILRSCIGNEHVYVGGNIGGSLLESVDRIDNEDWVVLELSSFMLEGLALDCWSPHVAVVTNVFANHLDRHQTLANYTAAKQVILDHQGPEDWAVLGPGLDNIMSPRAGHVHRLQAAPPQLNLAVPGTHNQMNAHIAVCAASCAGIDQQQAEESLIGFTGLAHRLQLVCEHNGVCYYNDSKSTTPQAAVLAIQSFAPTASEAIVPQRPWQVHVILGGYDKGTDLTKLGQFAGEQCSGVYTIGSTGGAIAAAACGAASGCSDRVYRCQTLDAAVDLASRNARSGDVVLLSPGCASWDQFKNYEKRGAAFAQAVIKHNTERTEPRPNRV